MKLLNSKENTFCGCATKVHQEHENSMTNYRFQVSGKLFCNFCTQNNWLQKSYSFTLKHFDNFWIPIAEGPCNFELVLGQNASFLIKKMLQYQFFYVLISRIKDVQGQLMLKIS